MNSFQSVFKCFKQFLNRRLHKHYISETDRFLATFDQEHPEKSASQKTEIKKYERINQLRDKVTPQVPSSFPL